MSRFLLCSFALVLLYLLPLICILLVCLKLRQISTPVNHSCILRFRSI